VSTKIRLSHRDQFGKLISCLALSLTLSTSASLNIAQAKKAKPDLDTSRASKSDANKITDLGIDQKTLNLVNEGKWAEAETALEEKVKGSTSPSREQAWLAFVHMYKSHCDSLKVIADATKSAPQDDLNVTLIQTFELICEKKLDDAEKRLQSLPATAMSDPFVNFAFAAVAGKQGKAAAAVTYTQRSVELAPDFAWGYRTLAFLEDRWLKDKAASEANYQRAVDIDPDLAEASNALIDLKLARNDFDGAIDVASMEIKHAPNSAANHYRLAQIYLQQWRLRESTGELEQAIALDSANAKYYRSLASILRYQGKLKEAIENQSKCVRLSQDKVFDSLELANMQVAIGHDNDAIAQLKEVIAIDPSNASANDQLERLLVKNGKFDDLIAQLKQTIAKQPKSAALYFRLGNALTAAGKFNDAIEAYKESANLKQDDAEPHRRIGAIKVAEKDFSAAAKEYTRALNINPNSVPDLVALGFCYGQTDDYLQAEAAFVTALALHQLTQSADSPVPPTRQDLLRALATLLFEEGRYADAASQFATIFSMSKEPTQALDKFMLEQTTALRDRSLVSFDALEKAFGNLSDHDKKEQQINLIDTLLRGKRFDTAEKYLITLDPAIAANFEDLSKTLTASSTVNKTVDQAQSASAEITGKGFQESTADKDKSAVEPSKVAQPAPQRPEVVDEEVQKNQRTAFIYICWSRVLRGKNELSKAEKAAQMAVDVSGKNGAPHSDSLCELAEVELLKNELDAAQKNSLSALDRNPKSFRAYDVLGRICLKKHDAKGAVEQATKALEINPYFTDGYLLLGASQLASNDLTGAYSSFQKAVNLYPGLIDTHQQLLSVLKKLAKSDDAKREESMIAQLKSRQ
jgi:tetratricopeptide (TPR) repeat protein